MFRPCFLTEFGTPGQCCSNCGLKQLQLHEFLDPSPYSRAIPWPEVDWKFKKWVFGEFPEVRWLGLHASAVGVLGSIPGQGTELPGKHTVCSKQKNQQQKKWSFIRGSWKIIVLGQELHRENYQGSEILFLPEMRLVLF